MSEVEKVLVGGNLSTLTAEQRVAYLDEVCRSLGLNKLTRPFEYITLNGKLTLYARKDCTDQLRKLHGVSITKLEREQVGDVYTVTAYVTTKDGRLDSSIGAVSIKGLHGDALANAIMKAETKAKRRATLSICGLGMSDETELETIPIVHPVPPAAISDQRSKPTPEQIAEDLAEQIEQANLEELRAIAERAKKLPKEFQVQLTTLGRKRQNELAIQKEIAEADAQFAKGAAK